MELPDVLFCNSPKCRSTITLKKVQGDILKNKVMVKPVILPCDHGYCYECATELRDYQCVYCLHKFEEKDLRVSNCMQEMCTWFKDNRKFIAAYISIFNNDSDSDSDMATPPASPTSIRVTQLRQQEFIPTFKQDKQKQPVVVSLPRNGSNEILNDYSPTGEKDRQPSPKEKEKEKPKVPARRTIARKPIHVSTVNSTT